MTSTCESCSSLRERVRELEDDYHRELCCLANSYLSTLVELMCNKMFSSEGASKQTDISPPVVQEPLQHDQDEDADLTAREQELVEEIGRQAESLARLKLMIQRLRHEIETTSSPNDSYKKIAVVADPFADKNKHMRLLMRVHVELMHRIHAKALQDLSRDLTTKFDEQMAQLHAELSSKKELIDELQSVITTFQKPVVDSGIQTEVAEEIVREPVTSTFALPPLSEPSSNETATAMERKRAREDTVIVPSTPVRSSPEKRPRHEEPLKPLASSNNKENMGQKNAPAAKNVVVTFSGFRESSARYNFETRDQLAKLLESLGAVVSQDQELNDEITHVVMPASSRTLKTFAASLMGKWLITDYTWITESAKVGKFVDEKPFGSRSTSEPFKGVRFFLSPGFLAENQDSSKAFRVSNAKNLMVTVGRGQLVDQLSDADYVLSSSAEVADHSDDKRWIKWSDFLNLILPRKE